MLHQFGSLEVDTDQMRVTLSGEAVKLRPRPYSLLEFLIQNQDRVVSKAELIEAVWHGKLVSDAALTSALRELRTAIGDPGGAEGLIRTFYGRGMRFVAPKERVERALQPIGSNTEIGREKSVVAILLCEVLSSDPELQLLADAISDEIIAKMSRFGLIGVLARSSTYSLRGLALSAKQIGERLGTNYVIESSLRQVGTSIRFTAHLVDVESETYVWTESFDLTAYHRARDQDFATTTVATSAITVIYECDGKRAVTKPFEQRTAWEQYCIGYSIFCTLDPNRQAKAEACFAAAVNLKPDFGEAYATWAYAICVRSNIPEVDPGEVRLRQARQNALELAQKALSIDPRVPFSWVALGKCHFALGELEEAISASRKALDLNPNLGWAHKVLAIAENERDRPEEAIQHFDAVLRTSPQDSLRVVALGGKGIAKVMMADYEGAIALSRAAQLLPDAGLTAHLGEVCALGHLGLLDEARDAVERAIGTYADFGIQAVIRQYPFTSDRVRRHLIAGLERAGLTS
ncbi:MAG: winged helix-turn-helix domain-containing protein [Pseudomonadota bacterium]